MQFYDFTNICLPMTSKAQYKDP